MDAESLSEALRNLSPLYARRSFDPGKLESRLGAPSGLLSESSLQKPQNKPLAMAYYAFVEDYFKEKAEVVKSKLSDLYSKGRLKLNRVYCIDRYGLEDVLDSIPTDTGYWDHEHPKVESVLNHFTQLLIEDLRKEQSKALLEALDKLRLEGVFDRLRRPPGRDKLLVMMGFSIAFFDTGPTAESNLKTFFEWEAKFYLWKAETLRKQLKSHMDAGTLKVGRNGFVQEEVMKLVPCSLLTLRQGGWIRTTVEEFEAEVVRNNRPDLPEPITRKDVQEYFTAWLYRNSKVRTAEKYTQDKEERYEALRIEALEAVQKRSEDANKIGPYKLRLRSLPLKDVSDADGKIYEAAKALVRDSYEDVCRFGKISPKKVALKLNILPQKLAFEVYKKLFEEVDQEQIKLKRKPRGPATFEIAGVTRINLGMSPLDVKIKKEYDFSALEPAYGVTFVERLATAFVYLVDGLVSAYPKYIRVLDLFRWLSLDKGSQVFLPELISGTLKEDSVPYDDAMMRYRSEIAIAQPKNNALQSLEQLVWAGILPTFSVRRIRTPNGAHKTRAVPTMLEAKPKSSEDISVEEAAKVLGITSSAEIERYGRDEIIAFSQAVTSEMKARNDLPSVLPDAIAMICRERLKELRQLASEAFQSWLDDWRLGRELIASVEHEREYLSTTFKVTRNIPNGRRNGDAIARSEPGDRLTLARTLLIVDAHFDGKLPRKRTASVVNHLNELKEYGGAAGIEAMLRPTVIASSALATLYLCESGSNVSVALSLEDDCLTPSSVNNHSMITSRKMRSLGKPIYSDLPHSYKDFVSAVEGIKAFIEVKRVCNLTFPDLLVAPTSGEQVPLEPFGFARGFRELISVSPRLSNYSVTPRIIRPTILLLSQLTNPADLSMAQRIAQHESQSTTFGYVRRLPFRLILDDRIRRFQDVVQVMVASKIPEAQRMLQVPDSRWNAAVSSFMKTGLGVYCSSPLSGIQPDYPKGQTCLAVDRCIDCVKMVVMAEPESIADMMIWQESLKIEQEGWLETRLQRWEQVWVPWLAFFHVVLDEKMSRGELAKIRSEAAKIVEKRKSTESFRRPLPW